MFPILLVLKKNATVVCTYSVHFPRFYRRLQSAREKLRRLQELVRAVHCNPDADDDEAQLLSMASSLQSACRQKQVRGFVCC